MKKKGKVLLVDDDDLITSVLSRALKKEGYETRVENDAEDLVKKIRSWHPEIILLDIKLPGHNGIDVLRDIKQDGLESQVVMLTSDDSAETAVRAMKRGAADYITKPFNIDEVKIILANILEKENLKQEVNYLRKAYDDLVEKDIIGRSDAIKELKDKIEKIAKARVSTILITGESGTGKEVAARFIHDLMFAEANVPHAPFISVNCAAMPESLLESELFGYEKGSFTDARSDKKGLFELARGGSLLLDEIGEMKQDIQSKLLRVLEERKIRPIGGKAEIAVEVTVIATTNRNLSEAVKKGDFRKDLFFRLSPFYLHIVPLRERKEDVALLAQHFLAHFTTKYNKQIIKGFSREAQDLLTNYSWPGNVRELKNLIERLVVLESSELIQPKQIPNWLFGHTMDVAQPAGDRFMLPDAGISLEDVEKDLILQALKRTGNNKTQAAKLLNMSYDSLRYQLKKFGL